MKPSNNLYKIEIEKSFLEIKTREDLLILLNRVKNFIYGEDARPILMKALTYYANSIIAKNRYTSFSIRKKSGGQRHINAPVKGLKVIQRCMNLILQSVFIPHDAASGFIPDRSIVENASKHTGQHYVYNIDLKDFFPSIELHRVKACLKLPPFNLKNEKEPLAFFIANLCCTEMEVERIYFDDEWQKVIRSVLPQGAPTSPTITNIVAQRLDRKLSGLCKRFGANYSRYADDITFSSQHNLYKKGSEFTIEMQRIITNENFIINDKKTRLQKDMYRQEVTGLIVNEKVNIRRRYLKMIRMYLHYWNTYGYVRAQELFRQDYFRDKGYVKQGIPEMSNVLAGKLLFMKMVVGADHPTYMKLMERFIRLTEQKAIKDQGKIDYNRIIEVVLTKGLTEAMELYERFKNP